MKYSNTTPDLHGPCINYNYERGKEVKIKRKRKTTVKDEKSFLRQPRGYVIGSTLTQDW